MNHQRAAVWVAFLLVLSFITTLQAADPAWYAKQSTWQETLKTSLDNKAKGITATNVRPLPRVTKGFEPFVTKVIRGGQAPLEISVPIKGLTDMVLMVTEGDDGNGGDHSAWANARLIDANGKVTWLDTIKPKAFKIGWGNLEIKANDTRRPVMIGNQTFNRYIFAHAFSAIHYEIEGKYVRFEASVGMDQRIHRSAGSVNFMVTNDPKGLLQGDTSEAGMMAKPLWKALQRDFPASRQDIMVAHDWLRQDDLKIEDAENRFKTPAAAALTSAAETLAYVTQSIPQAELAAELAALTEKHTAATNDQWRDLYMETRQLRRRIIFSHPALNFEKILINVNPPTLYSHNGDQHLGRHSRIGNGLTILTDWKTRDLKATPMLKAGMLPEGAVRNPDLHYDAEKVVFAFCDHTREGQKRYFLYEAALDGSWVRQLTGTARDSFNTWNNRATVIIEDNDPCYLPDGSLIFITTRCQSFGRCHGGRYNPAWTLHRCDENGDTIQQLSFGNENEYEPSVLNDGRIVFTRWEYTNRHEMFFHMLWACHPDGTNVGHFFGNDMLHPMMMVEATAIPGTHRVVTTAQGHHSYNTGTTVILDTNIGENTEDAITHITPETPYSETQGWPNPHYSHPYPVTEDLFLVSRANHNVHPQGSTPPPADRAIYLVDPVGGRELIYENPEIASFSPIAIRQRKRPPVMASMLQPDAPQVGTVFLQNAYLTRNDPEGLIKPGMIKAVRVIALGVQPRANRTACSLQVGVEIPKKVIGTIPVDERGAAYFKAPAGTSMQIQTLDENGMAILTEKSLFYLQPGENRSCVGCHEPEGSSPIASEMAQIGRLQPADLTPAAGPDYPGGLSFMRTVQPVLDRYCIKCHGLGEGDDDKGEEIKLIHDGQVWPQSFRALHTLGDHRVGDKPYMDGSANNLPEDKNISKPRRFYAYSNKVAHMLVNNHGGCNMDRDSYMRIIEWMDLNAQCYGDLFPNKLEERKIDAGALTQLRAYAKELFGEKMANQPERALINVAQIDESRILMAPLATEAGGWGQIEGYASRNDAKYKRMAELVDRSIVHKPHENTQGWEPTLEAGGGEDWVIKERTRYQAAISKQVSQQN